MTPQPTGSLAGIKVIDLSRVLAGPYCTQMLGDHGAQILKIEPPEGDEARAWGPPFKDGLGAYFSGINRNKQSLALNLSHPEGREVLLRLLEDADVLIENYKVGTMQKWGLDYETVLKARFSHLIYCRITGFGTDGPMGGLVGYDSALQAYAGIMSVNGEPDGDPLRISMPIVDLTTAFFAFSGILLALVERNRSGEGQLIDLCLLDSAISLLHPHAANWFMDGRRPKRMGNVHSTVVPYEVFKTESGQIFIGVGNNRQFARLCAFLGKPELATDPRFKDNASRVANHPTLTAELTALLQGRDLKATATALLQMGIPASLILEVPELMNEPQVHHRNMVVEKDSYRGLGIPIKMSRTPGAVQMAPPHFGAHSRAILADNGFSQEEIEALIANGVVLEHPPKA
jgi:formyl-CoA transferase